MEVIQKTVGLEHQLSIAIDFVGFARMVEALGGVEVCTTPLRDYELGDGAGARRRQAEAAQENELRLVACA